MDPRHREPQRDPEGVVRLVRDLSRLDVPEELDHRVALEAIGSVPVAGLATGLERQAAPAVLDRLVAEELLDPAAALTERFTGDLPRERPQGLTVLLRAALTGDGAKIQTGNLRTEGSRTSSPFPEPGEPEPFRAGARRLGWRAAALTGLAAAACLPFLLRPQGTERPSFRTQLTLVEDASQLDPLTLRLGAAMSGGLLGQGPAGPVR